MPDTRRSRRHHQKPARHRSERPEATAEYFVPDERKTGGAYAPVAGRVRHVSLSEMVLVVEDGTVVDLEDVVALRWNA